ncbi:hypothetical protein D3C77_422090 [compost metagenome]
MGRIIRRNCLISIKALNDGLKLRPLIPDQRAQHDTKRGNAFIVGGAEKQVRQIACGIFNISTGCRLTIYNQERALIIFDTSFDRDGLAIDLEI